MTRLLLLCMSALAFTGCAVNQNPQSPKAPLQPAMFNEVIAHSVQGRPINRFTLSGDRKRAVLVIGAIHGSEPASAAVAQGLIDLLTAEPQLAHGRHIEIIPIANPDGYERRGRLNANRIDLNRDFAASNFKPGPRAKTPLGEPESAAIAAEILALKPALIISVHAIEGHRQCNNYDGPGKAIADVMAAKNGYPVAGDIGYPVPGSLGSWAGKDLQIAMVTLELPIETSGPQGWEENRAALLAALAFSN